MSKRCKNLPDDCWEIVFDKMGHHSHLQTLTLVCKQFISVIRHLRTTFNLTVPAIFTHGDNLSFTLNQFPNIKTINLQQAGDSAPRLLYQIAMSSLKVESLDMSECSHLSLNRFEVLGQKMKSLIVLRCSNMLGFSDDKLAVIASCMPWLEDLDISCSFYRHVKTVEQKRVTDSGIEMISLKMKRLRKIDISGYRYVTNKSLVALSSNCVFLEQVVWNNCLKINDVGIRFVVENSPKLASVAIRGSSYSRKLSSKLSFTRAICLSVLDIHCCRVSDECLYSLSTSGMPLKSFTLKDCTGFSSDGISVLLKWYPSLEYLNLTGSNLTDHTFDLKELINCFSKLTTIKLKKCKVGFSTFFMLAKSCPVLKDIDMEYTKMGEGVDMINLASNPSMRNMRMEKGVTMINFASNPCIKSLNLSCNSYLDDKCLAILALACPSLEILDVSFCSKITKTGISSLMYQCSNIRHLEINGCKGIDNIGKGGELPKLEVLRAKRTGIDDKGLALIGKRCNELLSLDLEDCRRVTTKGLKDILEQCPRLREINIKQCVGVSDEIMDWMVFTRPSLRKIVPPTSSSPNVCRMQFYIRHGSYVWTPPEDKEYDDSLSSDSSSSSEEEM